MEGWKEDWCGLYHAIVFERDHKPNKTVGNIHMNSRVSHFCLNLSPLLKKNICFHELRRFRLKRTGQKRHQIHTFVIYQSAAGVTKEPCACAQCRSHTAHHVREGAAKKKRLLHCWWIIWWSSPWRSALNFALFLLRWPSDVPALYLQHLTTGVVLGRYSA